MEILESAATIHTWRYSRAVAGNSVPLQYVDIIMAFEKMLNSQHHRRALLLMLQESDSSLDAPSLHGKAVRARRQNDGSMVITLGTFDDCAEDIEDCGLESCELVFTCNDGGIELIKKKLLEATDAFRFGQTNDVRARATTKASESGHVASCSPQDATFFGFCGLQPMRQIAELLSSARGAPCISGVPGIGRAVPELTAFVLHNVNEVNTQFAGSTAEAIDASGADLLAWLLERHLDVLLSLATELANFSRNNYVSHVGKMNPAELHREGILCTVLPDDIELARRLVGERF